MRGFCRSGVTKLRNTVIISAIVILLCYLLYTKSADDKTTDQALNKKYRDMQEYTTIAISDTKTLEGMSPVKTTLEDSAQYLSNYIIVKSAQWDSTRQVIKILALIKQTEFKNIDFICEIRISIHQISVHRMFCKDIFDFWPEDSVFYAYICTCDSGKHRTIPRIVQLKAVMTKHNKTNSNNILVPIFKSELPSSRKKDIGICVKPLNGYIDVIRFIEWIEMHRMIGIQYFIVYVGDVNKSIFKVFDYYENKGMIKIVTDTFFEEVWASLSNKTGIIKYSLHEQSYLLSYNDCLYRFRNQVEEMFIVDIDEILVMEGNSTIQELIRRYRQDYPKHNGLSFGAVWHHEEYGVTNVDIPEYLHSQRYLKRSQVKYDHVKTIFKANVTEIVGWHMVHLWTGWKSQEDNPYTNLNVGWQKNALLHHFRQTCRLGAQICGDMARTAVIDTALPRYRDVAQQRVYNILKVLQIK